MKNTTSIVSSIAMLWAFGTTAVAQRPDMQPSLSQDFQQRVTTLTEALRASDTLTLDLMVPHEFRLTQILDDRVLEMPRRTWLSASARLRDYEYERVRAHRAANTVVVTSFYWARFSDLNDKAPTRYSVTDVWVYEGLRWQLVSRSQAALRARQRLSLDPGPEALPRR